MEKHSAKAVQRTVGGSAPHFEMTSLRRMFVSVDLGINVLNVGFKIECLVKCHSKVHGVGMLERL